MFFLRHPLNSPPGALLSSCHLRAGICRQRSRRRQGMGWNTALKYGQEFLLTSPIVSLFWQNFCQKNRKNNSASFSRQAAIPSSPTRDLQQSWHQCQGRCRSRVIQLWGCGALSFLPLCKVSGPAQKQGWSTASALASSDVLTSGNGNRSGLIAAIAP